MPHSPRWHDGNLYVLNSGLGLLEHVDLATGHRDTIAAVPGYARGLALHRGLAFVGLSKILETATFGGAPIAAYHDQLKCGVGVIELSTGNTIATLQSPTAWKRSSTCKPLPGPVVRPSAGHPATRTNAGCCPTHKTRPLPNRDPTCSSAPVTLTSGAA